MLPNVLFIAVRKHIIYNALIISNVENLRVHFAFNRNDISYDTASTF